MARVGIIHHKPIPIFSGMVEVLLTRDDNEVIRLVEPSGNVGTQYPNDVGSEWFGTIENLNAGLALGGAGWSDVYKTDVLWTTPSGDRAVCDQRKNDFNAVYGAMLTQVVGGPLRTNRMARFTHAEGFPDPTALFEVQIKAATGSCVTIGDGRIDYGTWIDHQPSGASVLHQKEGEWVTTLGPDVAAETEFIFEEQYAKPMAEAGVDFRKNTVWMEILVAVDDDPAATWERIETVRQVFESYFGDDRPAGVIYPVSRIPNLDSVVEPQPRIVSGDVKINRSGSINDGFSTWTSISSCGITEVIVSGVGGNDAGQMLTSMDASVVEAGGTGLKEDGVFNNAYIVAGADPTASRDSLVTFNTSYTGYYEGTLPAARTAQFMGGFQQQGKAYGISNRSIFAS